MEKGQQYTDDSNYTGGDSLISSKSKWYFTGVTEDGKKYKGTAICEQLNQEL